MSWLAIAAYVLSGLTIVVINKCAALGASGARGRRSVSPPWALQLDAASYSAPQF